MYSYSNTFLNGVFVFVFMTLQCIRIRIRLHMYVFDPMSASVKHTDCIRTRT